MLGHEPLLSLAEVHAVTGAVPVLLAKDIARVIGGGDAKMLIQQLGGVIKIAEELASGLDADALLERIALDLEMVEGKMHFGLSLYAVPNGAEQAERWGLTLKKQMKAAGRSVRYVDNRGKAILSSVSVEKNGLVARGREYSVVPERNLFKLARTLAVQPFEAFGERDFGRPGRDDVSGMLPPKLAIMMINCADVPKNKLLYDPSCGSGTIVSEAMLLGFTKLAGSDVSAKAVDDSKKNIEWTRQQKPELAAETTIFEHDVQKSVTQFDTKQIGGVVSEPYMGPPLKGNETLSFLESSARELAQLYLKTFQSFAAFIPKGTNVVYIFPRFSTTIRTAELVLPEIKKLGFKVVPLLPAELSKEPYILYQRDNQRVGREIWKFTF